MDERIERLGRQTFSVLEALLRTALRADALHPDPLLPALSGDLTLRCHGGGAELEVAQILVNPNAHRIHLTTTLPLPRDTRARAMTLGGLRAAGVERRAARRLFDAERGAGRATVLLHQQSPGIFTQEVGCLAPWQRCRVRTFFAFATPETGGAPLEMTVRFDAGASVSRAEQLAAVLAQDSVVRLGRGRLLDPLLDLLSSPSAEGHDGVPLPARGTFASCDTGGGACGIFHGRLAGRPVRLLLELRVAASGEEWDGVEVHARAHTRASTANTALVAISDDSACSTEPSLRAGTVTTAVRHGRRQSEISTGLTGFTG